LSSDLSAGLSLCFTQDGIPPDGAALEAVTVAYMLARKATGAAATAAAAANAGNVSAGYAATPARAWETWQHASGQMDAALGVPAGRLSITSSRPMLYFLFHLFNLLLLLRAYV
jgi:hypothetical protein